MKVDDGSKLYMSDTSSDEIDGRLIVKSHQWSRLRVRDVNYKLAMKSQETSPT